MAAATRPNFNDVAIDTSGNAMSGVQVTVDGDNLPIYAGRTANTLKGNPFTTTSNGLINFFADPGTYSIALHDTTLPARFSDRTIYWEAVSGDDDGILLSQLDLTSVTGDVHFNTNGVTTIQNLAVDTPQLADGAVTPVKLAPVYAIDRINTPGSTELDTSYPSSPQLTFTPTAGALYDATIVLFVTKTGNTGNIANIAVKLVVDNATQFEFTDFYVGGFDHTTGTASSYTPFIWQGLISADTGAAVKVFVKNIAINVADLVGKNMSFIVARRIS